MPCQQCENGKWKWGSTGECQYDSKESCEAANHESSASRDIFIDHDDLNVNLRAMHDELYQAPMPGEAVRVVLV